MSPLAAGGLLPGAGWALLAAGCAALAAALATRPAPAGPGLPGSTTRGPRGRRAGGRLGVAACGAALALVLAAVPGHAVIATAVVGSAVVAAGALLRRSRRRTRARALAGHVQEACDLLAADLGAGLPPVTALERMAGAWPVLAPVAHSASLGADVPGALRQVRTATGAAGLDRLAAAWEVSERTGQGLAGPVARTAAALRRARATRRVVDAELASARATARLLAALPVVALLLGSGAGGAPWRFLLTTTPGLVCLALGLAAALAGTAWIERIAADVESRA